MARPEERVVDAIKRRINILKKDHAIWLCRTHGAGRTKKGIPDLHLTFWGQSIWIEVKKPGGVATELQLQRLKEIRRACGFAYVVDSVDQFNAALREVLNHVQEMSFCMECRRIVTRRYGASCPTCKEVEVTRVFPPKHLDVRRARS